MKRTRRKFSSEFKARVAKIVSAVSLIRFCRSLSVLFESDGGDCSNKYHIYKAENKTKKLGQVSPLSFRKDGCIWVC